MTFCGSFEVISIAKLIGFVRYPASNVIIVFLLLFDYQVYLDNFLEDISPRNFLDQIKF